jgi:hypothetical protein
MHPETRMGAQLRMLADERVGRVREELLHHANAIDEASAGFYADPQTVKPPKLCSVWAKARRVYCRETGERLI